jgi:very-short-patch-repair endonuclease
MEALVALGIIIFLLAAIVGGIAGLVQRFARSNPASSPPPIMAPDWQPPKADPLPYSAKKYLFSAAERSFYEVLKRLVSAEHTLFAKVRLADLVHVSKGAGSRQSHFNRIDRKHIDFLLCDRNLAPVVAIELDDSSHDDEDRAARDEFVDQVLVSAGLPVVHIRAKRAYAIDQLRAELRPYIPAKAPAEVPHPDDRYMPPKGWRPAV